MKIRKGFVSNSSSSSFIVIGNGPFETIHSPPIDSDTLVVGRYGETQFGWDEVKYADMYSRINFAYLQTVYVDDNTTDVWLDMLESALKKRFNCDSVVWMISTTYDCEDAEVSEYGKLVWGYIDHQSSSAEGDNTEMFDNEDSLEKFLFCEDSYIQGDNDNH